MVRRRVERLVRSALRVRPAGAIASHLEGEHACDVGGERQRLDVEHQLDMLSERIGHAGRRFGQLARIAALVARFHALNATLDLADIFEILVEAMPIVGTQVHLQRRHLSRHEVEDAATRTTTLGALGARTAHAEQLLERHARVTNDRQRLGGRRPADGVGVHAGVAVRATAGLVDVLDTELHGRNRRILAEPLRVQLIERRADAHIRTLRLPRVRLREKRGTGAEVVTADFIRRRRLGFTHVGVADDRQVVAILLERRHRRGGQVELLSGRRRRPEVELGTKLVAAGRTVHHFDGHQARCLVGQNARTATGWNHRIEIRQRDRGTEVLQELPAGHRLAAEKIHGVASPVS